MFLQEIYFAKKKSDLYAAIESDKAVASSTRITRMFILLSKSSEKVRELNLSQLLSAQSSRTHVVYDCVRERSRLIATNTKRARLLKNKFSLDSQVDILHN